jgi:hypothetical protein
MGAHAHCVVFLGSGPAFLQTMSIVTPRPTRPEPCADETHIFVQAPSVRPERGWGGGMYGDISVGVELEDAIKLIPLSDEVRVIVYERMGN